MSLIKSRPTVSVVIPVHNRPAAVHRAIASVRRQTVQDFEIIVVDDGSTDDTCAAVTSIADPRIRLIRHGDNRGGSAARNTGIRASRGTYVAFLDSDDEWFETKLEKQLAVFARSSKRVALVYTGTERVDDGHVSRRVPRRYPNLARVLLLDNFIGETSVGMVRREVFDTIGGFDECLPSAQDLDLWLRICERFEAELVPEALVRVLKGTGTRRISTDVPRTILGRELYFQKHRAKMAEHGVLHLYLRQSGWWQQRRVRSSREARRYYWASLRANPLAPLTYVLLAAAYLPLYWLDVLAVCKHAFGGMCLSIRHLAVDRHA